MNNAGVKNQMTLESDDIDTIESSKKIFSKRDHVKSSVVRRFQHVSSFTSDETLMNLADNNGMKNSPITRRDTEVAGDMLGPSKHTSKGKETRSKAEAVNVNLHVVNVLRIIQ